MTRSVSCLTAVLYRTGLVDDADEDGALYNDIHRPQERDRHGHRVPLRTFYDKDHAQWFLDNCCADFAPGAGTVTQRSRVTQLPYRLAPSAAEALRQHASRRHAVFAYLIFEHRCPVLLIPEHRVAKRYFTSWSPVEDGQVRKPSRRPRP